MENQINIYLIIFFISFLLFLTAIVLLFLQYRNKQKIAAQDKQLLQKKYEQRILQNQMNTQTQTMHFIGREIHDNVGQKLTLASLYSKQLLGNTANTEEKINTIGNIIDESLADLRQLSKSLTNPALADTPLAQLLQEEAAKINSLGSCFVQITDNTDGHPLSPAQKNMVYRLLQEFIQNSLKHAACKKIKITLQHVGNSFTVTAADDGKGFNAAQKSSGQGLLNMQRRAEELQANYEIKSTPGSGTVLNLTFQTI